MFCHQSAGRRINIEHVDAYVGILMARLKASNSHLAKLLVSALNQGMSGIGQRQVCAFGMGLACAFEIFLLVYSVY